RFHPGQARPLPPNPRADQARLHRTTQQKKQTQITSYFSDTTLGSRLGAQDVLQLLLSGIAIGCIYGLVALGFLMVFTAVGALNFSHGELVMVGGYLAIWSYHALGESLAAAAAVSFVGTALVGALFERVGYAPLRQRSMFVVVVSLIAVGVVLRNVALNLAGPTPLRLRPLFDQEMFTIGSAALPTQLLAIIAATGALLAAQYFFFTRTRLGKMMQATAQDRDAARLMGIRVNRMVTFTFMLSAGLAAACGVMLAPVVFVSPDMGASLLIKAWVGAVIGGFGSIPGAIVGGILVGLLDTFTAAFISSDFRDALTMIVLIAFLIFRPQGIFGEPVAERV
ncbi:MAG: branched-chain amino acid ABC transporter permease, partial [Betaproteobacteria bacterium]